MLARTIAIAIVSAAAAVILAPGLANAASSTPTVAIPNHACYTQPGTAAQKQAILAAGGTSLDLAIAMEETSNLTVDYAYGDNKTNDSTNFGLFKQNWYMIRTSVSQYATLGPTQSHAGAVMNTNRAWDIKVLHASQAKYGMALWFAGHRHGQTGLSHPNTADISTYRTSVLWIQAQINANPAYRTDNTHCWMYVVAI
jgi:hypothetical protein